jgi:hypothetical protein
MMKAPGSNVGRGRLGNLAGRGEIRGEGIP